MTRNTPEYKKITKGPDLFKCQNGCEEVIKGLTPYKKYSFQIAAGTKIGLGNFSDPKEFLTAQAGTVFYIIISCTCLSFWEGFAFFRSYRLSSRGRAPYY